MRKEGGRKRIRRQNRRRAGGKEGRRSRKILRRETR